MENQNLIILETPIQRGELTISQIELMKPNAGTLRGVRLYDLVQSDVDALLTILPRITTPNLTKAECLMLDPVDLVEVGGKVISFLTPKSVM
ncbi:phage tail assembly protein [Nissabacter sp. SGAir0207]|uniref:phage tail assembly protein n=1 Tax=Nissabacter sp. SGAir0207 TaxID=2126321 RepID=UPI0010CD4A4F|nr:phage tail assembly protein [Nissabacter sp. SGAir0207]QCR37057.1 phage tail assembly protein [Nissabacter sp. SGAir0207]